MAIGDLSRWGNSNPNPWPVARPGGFAATTSRLDLGGIASDIGREAINIGTDWIRQRLLGGGGGGGGGTVVPGTGGVVPGTPLVPGQPAQGSCPDGTFRFPPLIGPCVDIVPGGPTQGAGVVLSFGEAVMGRYGAGLVPAMRSVTVNRCPPGAVLGKDNICYNRRDIRRDERKWVPGRRPLLTGGDLNAISRAARAAGKMKTQQKRLQKLGLLAKPKSGRGARRPRGGWHGAAGAPGVVVVDTD